MTTYVFTSWNAGRHYVYFMETAFGDLKPIRHAYESHGEFQMLMGLGSKCNFVPLDEWLAKYHK